MKQPSDSKKRIAFPIQLFNESGTGVAAPHEIHVIPTGEWEHWSGAEFEISTDTVAEIIRNFNSGERKSIPITAGHDNGMNGGELPAVGWFKELIDRGAKGINAIVEWTDEGKRLLSTKSFKYFSAELAFDYYDLENKKEYGALLVGGALTNRPFFKQLDLDPSFGFSEQDRKAAGSVLMFSVPDIIKQFNAQLMDIKDILAKNPADLTDAEKAHLVEHKEELNEEQKATFGQVLEPDPAPQPAPAPNPVPAPDPAPAPTPTDLSDKSKTVMLSAAEVAALKKAANDGAMAFAEVEKMKLDKEVEKFVFSESNKDGRILPKDKEAVVKFMFSLDSKQRDQFRNIVNALPKPALTFGEIGDGGRTSATTMEGVHAEVNTAVQAEIKASEGKLDYATALRKVFAEKPDLKKRYDEALNEANS